MLGSAALMAFLVLRPAAAQEWGPYDRPYLAEAVSLLKRLPSTSEHWRFVSAQRIPLQVTDNPAEVDDSILGAYSLVDRRIAIDEVILARAAEDLVDDGAAPAVAARVLAWKTLPTIVHELTHGRVHDDLRRLAGGPFALAVLEDEQLAFYDGCLALLDLFAEKPALWSKERLLELDEPEAATLEAWFRGPEGIDALVAQVYDGRRSLLKDDAAVFRAAADNTIFDLRRAAAKLREGGGAAEAGRRLLGRRRHMSPKEALAYVERALPVFISTRRTLDDPAALERVRAYYRGALAERRAKLEARRPRKG
ncbi:MAG: hypothetical protein HYZ75_19175 [Elusimicrobia bacterium]|nr:hypothetical protein [Elusimicrobiota bacterium]